MVDAILNALASLPVGIQTILGLIVFMLILLFVDTVFMNGRLQQMFCIYPRQKFNPLRYLTYPWIHKDFPHLAFNAVPFFIFGVIIALGGLTEFWMVTLIISFLSGLGVWLFASVTKSCHFGASGLVLGYFGYIFFRGFFTDNAREVVLALVVVVLFYFTRFSTFGNLRYREGVSNVGHWFGFLSGIAAAYIWPLIVARQGL
jgi:membrane associated rhomboid family serine protease